MTILASPESTFLTVLSIGVLVVAGVGGVIAFGATVNYRSNVRRARHASARFTAELATATRKGAELPEELRGLPVSVVASNGVLRDALTDAAAQRPRAGRRSRARKQSAGRPPRTTRER